MSNVRVLVGTRKGAFILTSDGYNLLEFVPKGREENPDSTGSEKSERVTRAMLQMKTIDTRTLKDAYAQT